MAPSSPVPPSGRKCVHYVNLDRVPRRSGGVLLAGRGGPAQRPVGELVDPPPRVLLEPTAVRTYARSRFPTAMVYGPVPDAELRLITCGGTFD